MGGGDCGEENLQRGVSRPKSLGSVRCWWGLGDGDGADEGEVGAGGDEEALAGFGEDIASLGRQEGVEEWAGRREGGAVGCGECVRRHREPFGGLDVLIVVHVERMVAVGVDAGVQPSRHLSLPFKILFCFTKHPKQTQQDETSMIKNGEDNLKKPPFYQIRGCLRINENEWSI